ncbi:MAG: hypothetical protein ACLQVK_25155 [Acidimicrobiales bacterium]
MSQGLRMVHLRTVPDGWHAKVLAARLGCEGIVTHLQGNVSGPYPFGAVSVLVEEDQAELAAALLLADEVEAAFSERQRNCLDAGAGPLLLLTGDDDILAGPDDGGRPTSRRWASPWRRAAAAVAALLVAGAPVVAHFIGQ